jgi:hypothetical protein
VSRPVVRLARPRLAASLLARESGAACAAAVAVVAGAGWFAAVVVTGAAETGGMPSLALRLLRRFDLALLTVAAVMAGMRVAVRMDEDRRAGWLEPYCAAGGCRVTYGVALVMAAALPAWILFTAGAMSFGTGILLLSGSVEMLRALTRIAPAGLLFVAVAAAHFAATGFFVREPLATVVSAALLAAAPYVATAVFLTHHEFAPVPLALRAWMQAAPPVTAATSTPELLRQSLYFSALIGIVARAGRHSTGRRT